MPCHPPYRYWVYPGGKNSGVFAASPGKAAALVREYILSPAKVVIREAEVMDIDEELFRRNRVSARLYGYHLAPYERGLNQAAKAGSSPSEAVHHDGIASEVINSMKPEAIYLVAPGTTTRAVTDKLGLQGTLLGIDAVKNRRLLAADMNESDILRLMTEYTDTSFHIIVTIIGRQGYLFGRGDQQLSPEVIRRVGKENLIIVATENKILSLREEPFLVDTGDSGLDRHLEGYIPVIIGLVAHAAARQPKR